MLRAFQWDLARQVERLDHLLELLPRYAAWGYQRLYLHLEDAVDYPSLPGVARADAYSWAQFSRLVAAATAQGIAVVPIANLLGHTQYLIKTDAWRDLNELRDPATGAALPAGQICPLHPRLPELVEKLFSDLAPLCTAGEIHCGLDESFHLGKHPLCRAEVAEIGLAAHFAGHVNRLHAAAARHGLRLGLWADMLALLPEAIALLAKVPHSPCLPPGPATCTQFVYTLPGRGSGPGSGGASGLVAYDWYYHPFGRRPRLELRTFAEYDLAPALAAAGIDYWACPMNGAFRHEAAPVWTDRLQNLADWWRRAQTTRAAGFLVTSWEPYRLSLPKTTLMDAAAASLWLEPERACDPASLLAAGLRRFCASTPQPRRSATLTPAKCNQFGYTLPGAEALVGAGRSEGERRAEGEGAGLGRAGERELARRLLATDSTAFVGNSRWEINLGWASVGARRDSGAFYARAARQLERLAATPALVSGALPALRATLLFQTYLARREVFVRNAASLVHRLRRQAGQARAHSAVVALTEACIDFSAKLRAARSAARAMWVASRPAASFATSQNSRVLAADAERLRALRAWLRAASRDPQAAFLPSPVAGRWTLRFTLHHFAPCHQKVVVEQQQPDGAWRELYGRVLIEFRTAAARAHTPQLRFELACPVDDAAAPLRIAARCLGEFAVSHIELTDGVTTHPHWPLRQRHTLGRPAAATGWPLIDWATNTATLPLVWGRPEE